MTNKSQTELATATNAQLRESHLELLNLVELAVEMIIQGHSKDIRLTGTRKKSTGTWMTFGELSVDAINKAKALATKNLTESENHE